VESKGKKTPFGKLRGGDLRERVSSHKVEVRGGGSAPQALEKEGREGEKELIRIRGASWRKGFFFRKAGWVYLCAAEKRTVLAVGRGELAEQMLDSWKEDKK